MNLDKLSLERNKNPIKVGNIELLQPTLGDIDDLGWEKYQLFLYTIITDSKDIADISGLTISEISALAKEL